MITRIKFLPHFNFSLFLGINLWLSCGLFFICSAYAQSTFWTGAVDNNWEVGGNWDAGVPNAGTSAVIDNGGTAQIPSPQFPGPAHFADLLVVGNGASGTLEINPGAVLISSSNAVIGRMAGGNGVMNMKGGAWTISNWTVGDGGNGTMNLLGGAAGDGTGMLTLANFPSSTGTIKIGNGGTAGTLQVNSVFGGAGIARIEFNHNGTHTFTPQVTGSVAVETFKGITEFTGDNTYTGTTIVTGGTLLINNTMGSGTGTETVTVGALGNLGGTGFVAGNTTVNGRLTPSNIADDLEFGQNLTLANGSITKMEIGGVSKNQYDNIIVDGNLAISGTLQIRFSFPGNGYVPANGDSFDLFDWNGTLSGNFANFDFEPLGPGQSWDTSELYSTGTITVVPEPSTWILIVIGFGSLGFIVKKKNRLLT